MCVIVVVTFRILGVFRVGYVVDVSEVCWSVYYFVRFLSGLFGRFGYREFVFLISLGEGGLRGVVLYV